MPAVPRVLHASQRSLPLAALLLVAACGPAVGSPAASVTPTDPPAASDTASPSTPSPAASAAAASPVVMGSAITIVGFAFDPPALTVAVGDAVTWTNAEDAFHTVTSGAPDADPAARFDSGELDTGGTFSVTFDAPGRYRFFCTRHDFMRGEVIVEG